MSRGAFLTTIVAICFLMCILRRPNGAGQILKAVTNTKCIIIVKVCRLENADKKRERFVTERSPFCRIKTA